MTDSRDDKQTVALDPRTITGPSWGVALATLEQLGPWAPLALKLGILALLTNCVRRMAEDDAPAALLVEADILISALRHMPWENK